MPTWSLTAGPAKMQQFRCSQSLLYMSTSPSLKQSWIASLCCQISFNRCTVDLLNKQINVCLLWFTRKECKQCEMLLIFGLRPWVWLWTHTNTVCNRLHMNLYTPLCKHWCTAVCKLSENQFNVVNIKWWDVYANVSIKVMGSRINKYWLWTSVGCVWDHNILEERLKYTPLA